MRRLLSASGVTSSALVEKSEEAGARRLVTGAQAFIAIHEEKAP